MSMHKETRKGLLHILLGLFLSNVLACFWSYYYKEIVPGDHVWWAQPMHWIVVQTFLCSLVIFLSGAVRLMDRVISGGRRRPPVFRPFVP